MGRYTDSDIQAVKDQLDLREVVSRDNGKTIRGERWLTNSPLRDDRNPSFLVTPDDCYDFALCERWDVFDYLREAHNMSFMDVMTANSTKEFKKLRRKYKKKRVENEPFTSPFTAKDYSEAFSKHKTKALPYMQQRGFDVEHLKNWKIGYRFDYHWYDMRDGRRIKSRVGRIAIPYFIGTDVHSVALRMDDIDLHQQIDKRRNTFEEIREDLAFKEDKKKKAGKQYKEVDDDMVAERMFGPRYKNWRKKVGKGKYISSKPTIFNGGTLLKQTGSNEYDFARKENVIDLVIDEGAINAMTAHVNGIPAIANKDYLWTHMDRICERVSRIIVFIHNDQEYQLRNGRKFIPGEQYWQKLQKELGHLRVLGLHLPSEYSDINEFWVKDPKGFSRYLDKNHVQRFPEYCLT